MKHPPSKLCKDCRFYGTNSPMHKAPPGSNGRPLIPAPGSSGHCYHLAALESFDPRTGERRWHPTNSSAFYQRQFPNWLARIFRKCGARARWFVSRSPHR